MSNLRPYRPWAKSTRIIDTSFQDAAPRHPVTGAPVAVAYFRSWMEEREAEILANRLRHFCHHTTRASMPGYVHLHLYKPTQP